MNAKHYINSIKIAIAQDATALITSTDAGVAVHSEKVKWYDISLTGLAALTIEQDTADGIKTKTAKLTAALCHDETLPPCAIFLLRTTDGEELLLGTPLRPHAIYAILRTFPAASSGQEATRFPPRSRRPCLCSATSADPKNNKI